MQSRKEGYFDYDELLLQRFSIGELLSEAHVDGVLWRAAVVVSKLLQFCNKTRFITI